MKQMKHLSEFASLTIGIMEQWSNGMMGLKEFFTIKMAYFCPYTQYSSIPFFHYDGIN